MTFFNEEGDKEGFVVLALGIWAAITLVFMIARSWAAGNAYWVAIFMGLICFAAAFSVYTWRVLILDRKGGMEDGEQQ
ncbi:hypothetical protein [Desulfitobacterium chlororespirans]|uniref:Uncharacterized protein n=1 Tax=Desulfitobacterium chlororespirans DSM 11544 TaxID=1121395 RepID=A0A1M7UXD2_9FIRM|nr:hypothetical protein [Desulfitobacterium chlororespirans]SHN87643.1 hypothetical protein SAMN02745215_04945 [Desulfitobacterium chlororespirans DSM 11544]